MVGDNIHGSERPQDFQKKFEMPYKPLLDAGVTFCAALGNHDDPNQRFYKPFNMTAFTRSRRARSIFSSSITSRAAGQRSSARETSRRDRD